MAAVYFYIVMGLAIAAGAAVLADILDHIIRR